MHFRVSVGDGVKIEPPKTAPDHDLKPLSVPKSTSGIFDSAPLHLSSKEETHGKLFSLWQQIGMFSRICPECKILNEQEEAKQLAEEQA